MIAAAAVIATGLLALYAFAEPSSGLYPRCSFRMLTGLSCPGCGTQRAIHALLHGNVREAFAFNAFLFAAVPLLALLLFSSLPLPRLDGLRRFLASQPFILSVLGLIVLWSVVRNIINI